MLATQRRFKGTHLKTPSAATTNEKIEDAATLIVESEYVVALTGAGISVESGVPTFRGPDGIWSKLGQPTTNGYKLFVENPTAWWEQYVSSTADPTRAKFRDAIDKAVPNPGHDALAELERLDVLKATITQNVDGLHTLAGSELIIEIHGNRNFFRCIGCEKRWPRTELVFKGQPPRCPECGDLIKSDTVMFGEPIPRGTLDRCYEVTERCDCMIAAGTSASVYPAANLPNRVLAQGGVVIEINPNTTKLSDRADVTLQGTTSEILPILVERVVALKRRGR
jgi:NAD-dependent deacetylase